MDTSQLSLKYFKISLQNDFKFKINMVKWIVPFSLSSSQIVYFTGNRDMLTHERTHCFLSSNISKGLMFAFILENTFSTLTHFHSFYIYDLFDNSSVCYA